MRYSRHWPRRVMIEGIIEGFTLNIKPEMSILGKYIYYIYMAKSFRKITIFALLLLVVFIVYVTYEKLRVVAEGLPACPPGQYLNERYNKCCARNQWYAPGRDICIAQEKGSCVKNQYMNTHFNKCCENNKYYDEKQKTCVDM